LLPFKKRNLGPFEKWIILGLVWGKCKSSILQYQKVTSEKRKKRGMGICFRSQPEKYL
jgi:hypothetical protein